MSNTVNNEFVLLTKPLLGGISEVIFKEVKMSYGEDVVDALIQVVSDNADEVIKLTNLMLPELKTVLARQRRDYGLDQENFPAQFPVENQATNLDDTPVHNIGMERFHGLVDYRLKKMGTLSSVSHSKILGKSETLRNQIEQPSFRSFKEAVQAKFASGADEKQVQAQLKERKRLDILEDLKEAGGPFTSSEEVKDFMKEPLREDLKKKRLKKELQFARESSVTLPKTDQIFKIQVTLPSKKRCDKKSRELSESLKTYLGNLGNRKTLEFKSLRLL